MNEQTVKNAILNGQTSLGIELGSTTIKMTLITDDMSVVATGEYGWQSQKIDGYWTYGLDEVQQGLQTCYSALKSSVSDEFDITLQTIGSIGVSAMMHGYLVFDKDFNQLASFRTWRNNTTTSAADYLTDLFGVNIPERWSIAHLYQAILNDEAHVGQIAFMTTLAGYVHYRLSGEKVLGIGDASGMFPIDYERKDFEQTMLDQFTTDAKVRAYDWDIEKVLPQVLVAGQNAGQLTRAGVDYLDTDHQLTPGSLMTPPEGDAATGMVTTNCIEPKTGNISVGTSIFSMVVLEHDVTKVHRNIDVVATPNGNPTAMIHVSNGTADLEAWINLFVEVIETLGLKTTKNEIYQAVLNASFSDDISVEGYANIGYVSDEFITKVTQGVPLFARIGSEPLQLGRFIKTLLYSIFATLAIGDKQLAEDENIQVDRYVAQGGLFKTPQVGQQTLADALRKEILVNENAGIGGAQGMALLALFVRRHSSYTNLVDLLEQQFRDVAMTVAKPTEIGKYQFDKFLKTYNKMLDIERLVKDRNIL